MVKQLTDGFEILTYELLKLLSGISHSCYLLIKSLVTKQLVIVLIITC